MYAKVLKSSLLTGAIALSVLGVTNISEAQDTFSAADEFQRVCALCHGIEGMGDGALQSVLDPPPSDLTIISRQNNGVFPYGWVYDAIDGRSGHGSGQMPAWGERYRMEGDQEAHARIQELMFIIKSMQRP